MWQQLALAGFKSFADEDNRKKDIESNVITQKYSPWTGQQARFNHQSKTGQNMIAGYGSGLLQDQMDAQKTAEAVTQKAAQDKADGDFYAKLSANPSSVGVSPIGGKSAFEGAAKAQGRAPAVLPGGIREPSRGPAVDASPDQSLPPFMQGQNPWLAMAQQPTPERLPLMSDFHEDAKKYSPPGSAWFNHTPLMRGR